VVRHADRAGQADSLSAAGVVRARELAHVASHAGVTAIFTSDTRRTRDTAAPLAAVLGITPEVYPAKDMAALMTRIRRDQPGETVLVVGHSNTVPMIIAAAGETFGLGGPGQKGPLPLDLSEDTYDDLFVLRVDACRMDPATVLHLRYGEPSP
jgi:broad specificity phosphatase PhoE